MLTLKDLFAGGGGASEGASRVKGVQLRYAANHWPTAVKTHQANHPNAEHACADLTQLDPRATPRTNIIWLSPSCTYHAQSQGAYRETEAAKQSRATMWCAISFAERHRYDAIIVENVLEVQRWVLWPTWLQALTSLGYRYRVLSLNSAHVGDRVPQSRDRLYVVATLGALPDLDALTGADCMCDSCGPVHATRVGTLGRYGRQYRYVCPYCMADATPVTLPAASVIDGDPGPLVAGRFADRTRWKIGLGIDRFDGAPFIAELRGGGSTVRAVTDPLSTITAGGRHHMLVTPNGPSVDDAHARMLTPDPELAAGQGFPNDYVWHGTRDDVARQIGNAVSVNTATALVATVAQALSQTGNTT